MPDAVIALSPFETTAAAFSHAQAQDIIHGITRPAQGAEASWIFDEPIEAGHPIEMKYFPNPFLIGCFETDSMWGLDHPPHVLKKGLKNQSYLEMDFRHDDRAEAKLLSIHVERYKRFFVVFEGEGHVFPPQNSEGAQFLRKLIERFVRAYLQ